MGQIMLKKDLAGFFAFFLGIFGVHRFYLGQWWRGAVQFLGFWTIIALLAEEGPEMPLPFILVGFVLAPIITAIVFWATPYDRWAAKYDPEALAIQGYTMPVRPMQPLIRRVPERMPTTTSAPKPSVKSLKAEGVKYYRAGDYDLAVEAFQEAISVAPTDPVAHFNLACCYALLGQYPDALRHLEHSITHELPKPERIESHPALAELRASDAYQTFRSNNYRQLNLLELTGATKRKPAPATEDVLEDFDRPPTTDAPDSERVAHDEDLLAQISRLKELHDAGILTKREYRLQREKLLG